MQWKQLYTELARDYPFISGLNYSNGRGEIDSSIHPIFLTSSLFLLKMLDTPGSERLVIRFPWRAGYQYTTSLIVSLGLMYRDYSHKRHSDIKFSIGDRLIPNGN
jgi:hypothetical protein